MLPLGLLVADDHPVVLSGLRLLLAGSPRYAIIAEAESAERARGEAARHQPDIIVTDLVMGGTDGIALIGDLATLAPAATILVYSSSDEAEWGPRTRAAGAQAYVSKARPLQAVAEALDAITADWPISGRAPGTARGAAGPDALDLATLSRRELQILTMMGEGWGAQQIGVSLGLSIKTIGTYRERLKIKLGFENMRMLDRYAAAYCNNPAAER